MQSKLILTLLFVFVASSCLFAQQYKVKEKKGKFGLFHKNKMIVDYEYDEFSEKHDDYYGVKNKNGWGLVNTEGETMIDCKYDSLWFRRGDFAIVSKDNHVGVVSMTDSILLDIKYDDIDYFYQDSLALVKLDGVWGYFKDGMFSFEDELVVFKTPEVMALYAYCDDEALKEGKTDKQCSQTAMLTELYTNIRYPALAIKKGVDGTVVIRFIVDSTGKKIDHHIIRDIGAGCGEEALRVILKMTDWIPAQQDGMNVAVQFNLPVKFKLR